MNQFKVFYKRGLGAPITVEAANAEEATKMGLAEFRRTNGTCEMVDFRPAEQIVEKVEIVL